MSTRHRNLRLVIATVALMVIGPRLEAQVPVVPAGVAAFKAHEIPERLLAAGPQLFLSTDQIRALKELAAKLRFEDAKERVGSKPWLARARLTSPQQAYTKAIGLVPASERSRAAALFAASGQRSR